MKLKLLTLITVFSAFFGMNVCAQVDFSIGTGTAANDGTSYPTPFQDFYEGGRAQYLYRASELIAAGMGPGNISAIKFTVTGLGTFMGSVEEFAIKIGSGTAATLTATSWETVGNPVFGPVNYVPVAGVNTFTFTTPYFWNGTDNIIIEICNGAANNGDPLITTYTSNPFVTWTTGLAFNGSHTYRADNAGNLCNTTLVTNTGTQTTRPNIIFRATSAAVCTGTPVAGTAIATPANITCYNAPFTLTLSGTVNASGLTYQWQSSPDNSAWANIAGATGNTYTTSQTDASRYYRAIVSCTGGGSSNSTSVQVTSVGTPPYTTLPFQEQFENPWASVCSIRDVPTNSWNNAPATGNSSWRRDDDGIAAAWTSLTLGAYTPPGSNNTPHSARFHSYSSGTTTVGTLDLYINANTSIAAKRLLFDYINTNGTDSLDILLSTNGGTSFTLVRTLKIANNWTAQTIDFTSSSATTIIRFRARGGGTTDIGVDEVNVFNLFNCTGTPVAGTIASTVSSGCIGSTVNLSVTGQTFGQAGISYQWQLSPNNTAWTDIPGATGLVYNFTIPSGYANTYYRLVVVCSFSAQTAVSNALQVTVPTVVFATLPFTETFEQAWLSVCATRDAPTNNWRNVPATGDNSWRREDDGVSATWASEFGNYAPAGSNGSAHSARFHSYNVITGTQGTLELHVNCNTPTVTKRLKFDFINTLGNDSLVVFLSTDNGLTFTRLDSARTSTVWRTKTILFNASSANTIIRFRATGIAFSSDIGLDNVSVVSFPNCAGTPVGGTAVASQTTACISSIITLSIAGQTIDQAGLSYKWQSSTDNTTWTDLPGAGTEVYNYTVPSGFINTYFRAVTSCSFSSASANSAAVLLTVPAPSYTTVPLIQSFDSVWVTTCATRDVPAATGWRNVPFTGNAAWRRDNDTTGGAWTNMLGTPATAGAAGTARYARIHTYNAATNGNLDLYINCSTGAAAKEVSFYYINPSGTDSFRVLLSTNGGTTFTPIGLRYTNGTQWDQKIVAFTSTSATTVIRFAAYGTGDFSSDIGIDQVEVKSVECAQPPNVTSTATSPTPVQSVAVFKWAPVFNALAYEIVVSTSPTVPNFGDITGDTTVTFNALTPVTQYYVFVRSLCFSGNSSSWYTYSFTTPCPLQPLPYVESFESITAENTLPSCMSATGLGTNVLTYTTTQPTFNRTPRTGSKFASFRYSTPTGGAWLYTQPVTLTAGTNYDASFWYRTDGVAGWQIMGMYYGTSQVAASMVKIDTLINLTNTAYTRMLRTFQVPVTGTYYLGIRVVASFAPDYLSVDDIEIKNSGVFPVTLLKFSGEARSNYNQLTWQTATELNSKGFMLERSKDGINFSSVGFVSSKAINGNSNAIISYTFDDGKPLQGTNYYRLKQIDKDDKFTYSNMVILKGRPVYELQFAAIYPNPAVAELNITVAAPAQEKVQIVITDIVGKQVYRTAQNVQQGETTIKLNVASLTAGSYVVKLVCENGCNAGIGKFIKQ